MGVSAGGPWTKIFLSDSRQGKFAFLATPAGIVHSIAIHYDTLATNRLLKIIEPVNAASQLNSDGHLR